MPSLVNMDEVQAAAAEKLAKEDFRKAVDAMKAKMIARRNHLLPWEIKFRWPVLQWPIYTKSW